MAVGGQAGLPEGVKPGNLPVSIEQRPPAHLLIPEFFHVPRKAFPGPSADHSHC